jgi:hypothetical protein
LASAETPQEVSRFLKTELDPASFRHADHVRVAFEMLRRHPFLDAAWHFAQGLRRIAAKAGRPAAYNETITLAFLSVIAERLGEADFDDFASFAAANPDLMEKHLLERWYAPARLYSETARRTFLLPAPMPRHRSPH